MDIPFTAKQRHETIIIICAYNLLENVSQMSQTEGSDDESDKVGERSKAVDVDAYRY